MKPVDPHTVDPSIRRVQRSSERYESWRTSVFAIGRKEPCAICDREIAGQLVLAERRTHRQAHRSCVAVLEHLTPKEPRP